MNPELPHPPRDEMELRLTALLLGELSAEETAVVRRALEQDGELAKLFARLSHTIPLVREAAASPDKTTTLPPPPLKLSEARRQQLHAQFKTVAPRDFAPERRRDRFTLVELAAVLVILGSLAASLLPFLSPSRSSVGSRLDFLGSELALSTVQEQSQADTMLLPPPASSPSSPNTYSLDAVGYVDAAASESQPVMDTNAAVVENSAVAEAQAQRGEVLQGLADDAITVHRRSSAATSVVAPSPKIELPVVESSISVVTMDGQAADYADNTSLGSSRGLTMSAPSPISGEPVATPEFGVAQNGRRESEKYFRLYSEPNPVPPSAPSGLMGNETLERFSRADFVDQVALGKALKEIAEPADRGGRGRTPAETAIPRVSVAGRLLDEESRTAGLAAITATNFAGAPNQGAEGYFAWQSGNLKSTENKATWADYDNEGWLARSVSSSAPASVSGDVVPVLGDSPTVGQQFQNSGLGSFAAGSSALEGRRIVPDHNVTSFDVVATTEGKSNPADSAGEALNAAAGPQPTPLRLHDLKTSVEKPQLQVATPEGKPAGDSQLTGGLRNKEALLAKAEVARRPWSETPAIPQDDRPYFAKKRELQELTDMRRFLTRKMAVAGIDQSLPKSSQVVIVERATPKSAPNQTLWGTLRSAVSGDAERVAKIKVERDKSDIEELSGKVGLNAYDPYFIQPEFDVIQSEAVLGQVVSKLELDEEWARKKGAGEKLKTSEAVALLRKQLDLRAVPNTALVEIRAKADQPEEAAQIANAVAEAYKEWRLEQSQRLVAGGLELLGQRIAEQDGQIRRAQVALESLGEATSLETDRPVRTPATNAPIPQPEVQTSENNFSTFSLNVSDVSFKLAAASLEQGQLPDMATVRSEEFINAFDYRDPEPAPGAPIAFAWERARYPFAQNRDLLRLSLKTAAAGRSAGRPLNVVLLLDNSGSMERADRVQIIREALRVLAGQLQPEDKLSVITFARTARLVADGISGAKAGEVTAQVGGLTPEGGTNLEAALNLAYQTAARHYLVNGINRVVLLTDGAANLGDVQPDSLKQKVEAQRQQGIALDCFGIGWDGFNDDLLEVLSRNGDGRYGFINSPEEAATEFVGQLAGALQVAASDVKVQVEFNPKRVTAYRQIGYAKHQLTKEQFRDNTVDAAEIAAQEAGNALYTVAVNPAGEGPLGTVRVRYKVPGTTDYREQSWDVPFTGNALALEQSSPALRLAASASAFSEWLVASPFAGEVTADRLLGYLAGVPDVYGADGRPKKLEWMIRQAKSLEGK